MIDPTFDELATMSVIDHSSVGCGSCSENVWSATLMVLGTTMRVSGSTIFSSRAAAMVIILLTEPGS